MQGQNHDVIRLSFLTLVCVASPALSQTNFPAYRQVKGRVYNVALSTSWTTVTPKKGFVGKWLDPGKRPEGQLLTVAWSEHIGRTDYIYSVDHVPYSPQTFKVKAGTGNDLEPLPIPYRVFLLKGETNWPPDGILPRSVHLTYDYGLPVGTKEKAN